MGRKQRKNTEIEVSPSSLPWMKWVRVRKGLQSRSSVTQVLLFSSIDSQSETGDHTHMLSTMRRAHTHGQEGVATKYIN